MSDRSDCHPIHEHVVFQGDFLKVSGPHTDEVFWFLTFACTILEHRRPGFWLSWLARERGGSC